MGLCLRLPCSLVAAQDQAGRALGAWQGVCIAQEF